jgi:hypothetical protein
MSDLTVKSVKPQSEEVCLDWGGEFRGRVCARVKVESEIVKICVRGEARRIGSFDECFNALDACYTLLDVKLGKLKCCIKNIEFQNGLPSSFVLQLKVDPIFGSDVTLIEERIRLLAIQAKYRGDAEFDINSGADGEDLVMILAVTK